MDPKAYYDYVRNLKIKDMNNRIIENEFVTSNINKNQILPITVEEPKPFENRENIMMFLKTITYEPNKFYTYLFDKGEINIFSQRMNDFYKEIYGRTNMSSKELEGLWQKYITLTIDRDLKLKGIPQEEVRAYEYLVNPIAAQQSVDRTKIRKLGLDYTKLKELEQIEKKMKEMGKEIVRANVFGDIEKSNTLNDELMKLDRRKRNIVNKIGLEKAKEPFNPVGELESLYKSKTQTVQNAIRASRSSEIAAEKQSELQKSLSYELQKRDDIKRYGKYRGLDGYWYSSKTDKSVVPPPNF
jgi:hypothetical protein